MIEFVKNALIDITNLNNEMNFKYNDSNDFFDMRNISQNFLKKSRRNFHFNYVKNSNFAFNDINFNEKSYSKSEDIEDKENDNKQNLVRFKSKIEDEELINEINKDNDKDFNSYNNNTNTNIDTNKSMDLSPILKKMRSKKNLNKGIINNIFSWSIFHNLTHIHNPGSMRHISDNT